MCVHTLSEPLGPRKLPLVLLIYYLGNAQDMPLAAIELQGCILILS